MEFLPKATLPPDIVSNSHTIMIAMDEQDRIFTAVVCLLYAFTEEYCSIEEFEAM